jgi:hypothetical protein
MTIRWKVALVEDDRRLDRPELFEAFRAETDAALGGISARSSVSDRIAGLKLGRTITSSSPSHSKS